MAESFSLEASTKSASPLPVITYWSGRGLCEPLRCIFAAAGVPFENNFIRSRDDYLAVVQDGKLEYDQMPLVQIDGLNLVQSAATAHYLATRYNFMPTSIGDNYIVGHVWEACRDARKDFVTFPWNRDREELRSKVENSPTGLLQRYCPKWEKQLSSTSSDGPFVLGSKATLADIGIFEVLDFYSVIMSEEELQSKVLNVFPNIATMYSAVLGLGRLKIWRDEERPALLTADWEVYADCVIKTLTAPAAEVK